MGKVDLLEAQSLLIASLGFAKYSWPGKTEAEQTESCEINSWQAT